MRFKLGLAVVAFVVGATSLAYGDGNEDIIKMRQRLMDSNGQALRVAVTMARGDVPFDADIAAAVLATVAHDNEVFYRLFPDGTQSGKTKAAPAIWSDKEDFQAHSEEMVKLATTASEAASQGLDEFKAALGAVGKGCQACHEKYRQS